MLKVFIGIQPTTGQDGIGCTDNRRFMESVPDVFFIIILKERSVNDAKNILFVVKPVVIHDPVGYFLDQVGERNGGANIKFLHQSSGDSLFVFFPILEQVRCSGIFSPSGISHIKDIFQFRVITGGINEGNAGGTSPYIPSHLPVPEFIVGTGGCLRPLGKDHKLLMVRVLIDPCHGSQKGCPFLLTACDFNRRMLCQLCVELQFRRHRHPPTRSRVSNPELRTRHRSCAAASRWRCR